MRLTFTLALPAVSLAVAPLLTALPSAADSTPAPAVSAVPAVSWDFDGDGVRDLAGGDPGQEEGGPGQVLVRRGTSNGYGEPLALHHPSAPEGNDAFGASLASADLDLDGYADLVVGAPTYYPQRDGYGSVTIFRGSAAGLTQESATSVVWPRRTDGDLRSFGRSVVVARLDGDQWPDIAVGAPDDDGDSGTDRSLLVVLRGGPSGWSTSRAYPVLPPSGTRWFGEVLAAGDVDRDGHVDLVESGTYPDKGSHLSLLRGTSTGPHKASVFSTGWADSIAIGSLTGDRFPDVVVSRPYARYDNTRSKPFVGAGSVTLYRGSAAGLRAGVSVTQESRGVPGSSTYRDFFGASVAILDVNHNGRNEVVVGVPGAEVGSVRDAGAVTVLRVGSTGFLRTGNRMLTKATDGVPGDPRKFAGFGAGVSAQDRSRDGVPDLLVASREAFTGPEVLTVLQVVTGPLATGAATAATVLDGALPRDASSS
jgi:hypothetical protein